MEDYITKADYANNQNYTRENNYYDNNEFIYSKIESRFFALLLCLFFGGLGIHRFYVRKVGTGILYLLTAGFWGLGVLIDFLLILFGAFSNKNGQVLKKW